MVSPICTVNSTSTLNGVNVTAGSTVTIALQNISGVSQWSITCTSTNDLNAVPISSIVLTVNQVTKTATFVCPNSTVALQFTSLVNNGVDVNGISQPSYKTTFGVYVPNSTTNQRLIFVGQKLESDSVNGWTPGLNYALNNFGGGGVPITLAPLSGLVYSGGQLSVGQNADNNIKVNAHDIQLSSTLASISSVKSNAATLTVQSTGGALNLYGGATNEQPVTVYGTGLSLLSGGTWLAASQTNTFNWQGASGVSVRQDTLNPTGASSLVWAAGVTSISNTWSQSTVGVGGTRTISGQQGKAGSVGGDFILASGSGGTPGTNLGGTIALDVGAVVSNASPKVSVRANGSANEFFSIQQTNAFTTTISTPLTNGGITVASASNGTISLTSGTSVINLSTIIQAITGTMTVNASTFQVLSPTTALPFFEYSQLSSTARVISLCRNGTMNTTAMPTGSGDGVVNLANATTVPTVSPDNTGIVLYANGGQLFSRDFNGKVVQYGVNPAQPFQTVAVASGTITPDWSLGCNLQDTTLSTGTITVANGSNEKDGGVYTVIIQVGSGQTVSFGTLYHGNSAATANLTNMWQFIYNNNLSAYIQTAHTVF